MSHTQIDESPDEETVFPFLIDSLDDRGQSRFCKILLVNLLNQESVHAKQNSQM